LLFVKATSVPEGLRGWADDGRGFEQSSISKVIHLIFLTLTDPMQQIILQAD